LIKTPTKKKIANQNLKQTKTMKKAIIIFALTLFSAQLFAQAVNQAPPIPGIGLVVKKNPGGGASIVLNPTPEGRTNFSLSEAGDYTVNVQSLSSVSLQGGPVRAVKVGLSKNPPNAIIARCVSDDNGDVEFKNLAPGDYAIEITESGKTGLLPVRDIGAKRAKPLQKVSDIPYKQFNKQ
jgi:hypothetical protein